MMKKTISHRLWALVLCLMMAVSVALFAAGCGGNDTPVETTLPVGTVQAEGAELGEGATTFSLSVTNTAGETTQFTIHTDKKTVGEALVEVDLVQGDPGEFGLYIKTVNGETVDYDKDGKYWAFYVNGEYAVKSVDQTEINEGDAYELRVE